MRRPLHILLVPLLWLPLRAAAAPDGTPDADTTIVVDRICVTAIKQGPVLREQPLASTVVGSRTVRRRGISSIKELSQLAPNFHAPDYGSRMTSSLYVRGLGARIDQPAVGLNVDNVPVMNKNCFDAELTDIDRIEVLRGPQSTLYGRNTMAGVVNVYTRSPLAYEGVRLAAEYGSGTTARLRASIYRRLGPDLGLSVAGYWAHTGGFFRNAATGALCDSEQSGGGRLKLQWRRGDLSIDNTLSLAAVDQGGYPYAYVGPALTDDAGNTVIRPGEIRYNDPCSYRRTTLSDGLTVRYDAAGYSVASITGYHYADDRMTLDQDFLPLSYFTLTQALREHTLTQDLVFRSRDRGRWRWVAGLFGFYRHGRMSAPVDFKETGIDRLIFDNANTGGGLHYTKTSDRLPLSSDFRMPVWGAALYHESTFVAGRWRLTAGLRADFERTRLTYRSRADLEYLLSINGAEPVPGGVHIDERRSLARSYAELLPKFSALYAFDSRHNLYLTVARGYKAGGFNTQIFSDILQEKIKWAMVSGLDFEDPGRMSYEPEYSWNFEVGGHFSCMEGALRGDVALFWIECRNQQLTVFPEGTTTGRMMTNAGRTRSRGAEISVQATPAAHVELQAAWGFTDARFRRYFDGNADYAGRRIPYAPRHTLAGGATWTIPTGSRRLGDVVLHAGVRCTGPIAWNEQNTLNEPFYALLDASAAIEHRRYTVTVWGRNLADRRYNVFYFKSIGNEFVQLGRPRSFGITLTLNID